jgi:hypothetical protein
VLAGKADSGMFSDTYSYGVLLNEMASRQRPWCGWIEKWIEMPPRYHYCETRICVSSESVLPAAFFELEGS